MNSVDIFRAQLSQNIESFRRAIVCLGDNDETISMEQAEKQMALAVFSLNCMFSDVDPATLKEVSDRFGATLMDARSIYGENLAMAKAYYQEQGSEVPWLA